MERQFVFICGCPRSGTTMLADLLGASSQVIALQETGFKFRSKSGLVDYEEYLRIAENGDHTVSTIGELKKDVFPMADREFYEYVVSKYIDIFCSSKADAKFVIDQTPNNVLLSYHLSRVFPSGKFIHIVRDGRAVFNSVKKVPWGPSTPVASARWWTSWVAPGLAMERSLGADRVLRVHYEDLVSRPEIELRRLCDFVGLDYVDSMLRGGGVIVSAYARDIHPNVGAGTKIEVAGKWRSELSDPEKGAFMSVACSLLAWLGYDVSCDNSSYDAGFFRRLAWISQDVFLDRIVKPLGQKLRAASKRMAIDK